MQWCNMNGIAFKKALYSVPDPDLEIRVCVCVGGGGGGGQHNPDNRGGGGGGSRPLDKVGAGGGLQKIFFRPFGLQFGLKIRGGGAILPSPEQLCNKA